MWMVQSTTANRAKLIALTCLCFTSIHWPAICATLEVGPGKPFDRIEDANQAAKPGDVILLAAGVYKVSQTFLFHREFIASTVSTLSGGTALKSFP